MESIAFAQEAAITRLLTRNWGKNMTIGDAEPLHDTLEWKECEIIGTVYDNYELKK